MKYLMILAVVGTMVSCTCKTDEKEVTQTEVNDSVVVQQDSIQTQE